MGGRSWGVAQTPKTRCCDSVLSWMAALLPSAADWRQITSPYCIVKYFFVKCIYLRLTLSLSHYINERMKYDLLLQYLLCA